MKGKHYSLQNNYILENYILNSQQIRVEDFPSFSHGIFYFESEKNKRIGFISYLCRRSGLLPQSPSNYPPKASHVPKNTRTASQMAQKHSRTGIQMPAWFCHLTGETLNQQHPQPACDVIVTERLKRLPQSKVIGQWTTGSEYCGLAKMTFIQV